MMPSGFRIPLKDIPEQPGERRVSIHWFFLPAGLGWLAAGVIGVRDSVVNGRPFSKYWGAPCALLGIMTLLSFIVCQAQIRRGTPPKGLITIRARPLILAGGVTGYTVLCFVMYRFLPGKIMWTMPFVWVLGSALIWNGTVRYFRKHPPK